MDIADRKTLTTGGKDIISDTIGEDSLSLVYRYFNPLNGLVSAGVSYD